MPVPHTRLIVCVTKASLSLKPPVTDATPTPSLYLRRGRYDLNSAVPPLLTGLLVASIFHSAFFLGETNWAASWRGHCRD